MIYTTFLHRMTTMLRISVGLLAISIVAPLCAQVSGGTITGTVIDPSGAAVDKAQVDAVNDTTNKVTHTVTSSAGLFNLPNIDPGNYTVTVAGAGFAAKSPAPGASAASAKVCACDAGCALIVLDR